MTITATQVADLEELCADVSRMWLKHEPMYIVATPEQSAAFIEYIHARGRHALVTPKLTAMFDESQRNATLRNQPYSHEDQALLAGVFYFDADVAVEDGADLVIPLSRARFFATAIMLPDIVIPGYQRLTPYR